MKKLLFIILLLGSFFVGLAQVSFRVLPQTKDIYTSQPFRLEFIIDGSTDLKRFVQPAHKDLIYLEGPSQRAENISINGKNSKYFKVGYTVVVHEPGNIILTPATAYVENKILTTDQILIKILPRPKDKNEKKANDFPPDSWPTDEKKQKEIIAANTFVKLEADNTNCYVGQPITVDYKLYTRLKSQFDIIQAPTFNGFSVSDIFLDEGIETLDTIQGKIFAVYLLKKAQITPLNTGNLKVDKLTLKLKTFLLTKKDNEILKAYNGYLPYDIPSLFFTTSSNDLNIDVKPLPQNKPDNFKGAVGNFKIAARIDENNFPMNKRGKFILEIEGAGNLKMLTPPDIEWPEGIEVFESIVNDDINFKKEPIKGRRQFHFPFTVSKPGNYTIPALEFTTFNPQTNLFEQLVTEPTVFQVSESVATPIVRAKKSNENLYTIIGSAIMILVLAGIVYMIVRKKGKKEMIVAEAPIILEVVVSTYPFEQSKNHLYDADYKTFYKTLYEEFKTHITSKLGLDKQTEVAAILHEMDKKGIQCSVSNDVSSLFLELDEQLYAPHEISDNRAALLRKAESINFNS